MAPRTPLVAPPLAPPRVGLLASAILDPEGLRWETGFSFDPEGCGGAGVTDPCGNGSKTIGDNRAIVTVEPFWVWAGDKCSSFGFAARDYQGRARRLLEACESAQIASEFWTGTLAQASGWDNAFLASPDSDVLSAGGMAPADALACLEQGLGQCGCGARGMIHATRQTVTAWASQQLVRREGGQVLTVLDTIVVPDAGYDGSGPDGTPAADGAVWAYATDMVAVRRSAVRVIPGDFSEALDRSVNTIEFRAERLAAVSWSRCCHLAVQVDIDVCAFGGPGS